jgi:hypothetical protein
MDLDAWLTRLQDLEFATVIRENGSIFPWVESVHVLGLTTVIGTIAVLDVRLLGLGLRDRPVRKVLADVLPCTWIAFVISVISGLLLFASNALTYAHNPFFRAKLGILLLIAVNAAVFARWTAPGLDAWDTAPTPPPRARVSGAVSIALWVGVVVCGRWIGFTRLAER